jgi:hypothetical protein
MDPNATLRRIREALADIDKASNPDSAGTAALEATDAMRDLDEWLSRGGALPQAWERRPVEVVDAELEEP